VTEKLKVSEPSPGTGAPRKETDSPFCETDTSPLRTVTSPPPGTVSRTVQPLTADERELLIRTVPM